MNNDWDKAPELNITPLVDVMLVLLAILMLTTPVMLHEENIILPSGSNSKQITKIPEIEIKINNKRQIFVKKQKYNFATFPDSFLGIANKYKPTTPVYIRADKNLKYEDVIYILKSVKSAGLTKVSLMTDI
ncbi:MAG: Biopolymer transport protein ExbD/TolR [uncultured Campylobacterales bacterium]|uniref:Biopolymer transport protein ExbD/TolR n=1 Tax=uncultured Campylobacterales bacterium TaxID=352960 RepID=A0A6S6S8X2_9BACT|nr:MAG: Biopolymer transport protein ExbD/TolR [uncultured Campylobacterales bacterium]